MLLFAKRSKIEIDYFIFPQKLSFQRELAKIFGIENKIIPSEQNSCLQAKNLILPTLFTDYEIVEYRGILHYRHIYYFNFLNTLYSDYIHQNTNNPIRKIFLKRPENSNRNFSNAKEVEAIFQEFGFEIILPDSMSLKDQIELFSQTLCLASLHGSGLDNVLFMHKETFVFEIFSESYFDASPQSKALIKKCHYFYLIGETQDTSTHPQFENTYLNPERLKEALKILDSHIYNYGTKANMLKSH